MSIYEEFEKKIDEMNELIKKDDSVQKNSLIGRKAFLSDPFLEVSSSQGSFRRKFSKLSNRMLRESATRDTILAAIIRHRRTQIEAFCNIPNTRFDVGMAFVRSDGAEMTAEDQHDANILLNWMYFCGDVSKTPENDKTTLATQFGMMTQDILTFGHIAGEKIRDQLGGLQRFRHVPGESVFHSTRSINNDQIREAAQHNSENLPEEYKPQGNISKEDPQEEIKFLQIIDSREVAWFTDKTMFFNVFQPPSFIDNNGYSMSLVEASIMAVTRHLQAENYNSLFFTHGFAARGLLHLKGNVSQANLQMFRNQFNAVINGNSNSWRTPIIAGLDDVQWIPLSASSREMEYIQYTDHLIRTICAIAQIDPTEIGFEYLSRGTQQSTLNSPNNEWKLTASQERGLVPLLRFFEDMVNHDIIPELNPKLAEKFKFKFIGLQSETKQQETSRLQTEMTVHASLNDILNQVKKQPIDKDLAGDIPLNSAWWSIAKELLTVGELRERLLGDEGASKRQELKYIPSSSFLQWQTFLASRENEMHQRDEAEKEQEQASAPEDNKGIQTPPPG